MKTMMYILATVSLILLYEGCRKPYDPPAITSPGSYLVVAGVINGSDSTIITLSRTVSLSSNSVNTPVTGATVFVQSNQNNSYPLVETRPGTYSCPSLSLNNSYQYRVSISTGGEQYQSDYVPVVNSPPIDSVGYTIASNGLNIYSNTHDPTSTVKYYRWDYTETWLYHPRYASGFVSTGDTVIARPLAQQEENCWPSDTSSTIVLNSSVRLSRAVILNNPITFVSSSSQKIADEYSISVRQYALTPDAYTFWQTLKNNTENLGSIFDPQPSQLTGNIHSLTKPNEPVVGYISAGNVATKRIFIHNQQLPAWVTPQLYTCPLDTFYYSAVFGNQFINQVNLFLNAGKGAGANPAYIPVGALTNKLGIITAYTASSPECTECTLQGPNVEPSFWQ
jgi:hypothetical protein